MTKQKQIEDFIRRNKVDVLHCQEINIDEDSFSQCNFITSNFSVLQNNALNKYGTATLIRNVFTPENVRMDTSGRAIFFNIENITLGNVYIHSGTDGLSRGARENYCSETIPQLLMNRKDSGCWGGDLNCVTRATDCTHNPESKLSPSLTRLINTLNQSDSFRWEHPG